MVSGSALLLIATSLAPTRSARPTKDGRNLGPRQYRDLDEEQHPDHCRPAAGRRVTLYPPDLNCTHRR